MVLLSHPYVTTGKTIDLTRRTFVGKVISLLFNKLSRLVITFLPRSKCLLISWLQWFWSLPKIKSVAVSTVSPSICHEVSGPDAMILVFWMFSFKPRFPCGSDGRVCLQCGRPKFSPWVRKIPWRRKWQSTPALLPGKSHGQRSLIVHGVAKSQTQLSELIIIIRHMDFPGSSDGKESACNAGDFGLIPELGRSPGGGNGNLLQYSCPENSMERGAWWTTVHGVAGSRTKWLSGSTVAVCVC